MRQTILAFFVVLLPLSGCVVYSTNPLSTGNDLEFDPGLAGTWVEKNPGEASSEAWTLEQSGANAYVLVSSEGERSPTRLVRIGKHRFLDIEHPENESGSGRLLHLIVKVKRKGDSLEAAVMDDGWFNRMVEAGKVTIGHDMKADHADDVILTAPTVELRAFLKKFASNSEAFPVSKFERRK